MPKSNIYVPLWTKYRPAIIKLMQEAGSSLQQYRLSAHEFKAIGDREKAGYSFLLKINNGVVKNSITGTAVARDLLIVLQQSKSISALLENAEYEFRLNNDFVLSIKKIK